MKHAVRLIVLIASGFASVAASAQFCSTTCSRYEEGECVEHTKTCTNPSAPSESYGAIAYSRTSGSYGTSYKWSSRAKAESVAMQNCAKYAKDCEATVWFNHKCGAVSADPGPTAFWGLGNTIGQARAVAQQECMKGGRKGCTVEVSACSN
jgi:serine/threonine-protein kinase